MFNNITYWNYLILIRASQRNSGARGKFLIRGPDFSGRFQKKVEKVFPDKHQLD